MCPRYIKALFQNERDLGEATACTPLAVARELTLAAFLPTPTPRPSLGPLFWSSLAHSDLCYGFSRQATDDKELLCLDDYNNIVRAGIMACQKTGKWEVAVEFLGMVEERWETGPRVEGGHEGWLEIYDAARQSRRQVFLFCFRSLLGVPTVWCGMACWVYVNGQQAIACSNARPTGLDSSPKTAETSALQSSITLG